MVFQLYKILYLVTALIFLVDVSKIIHNGNATGREQMPLLRNINAGFEQGLTGWESYVETSIASDAIIRVVQNEHVKFGTKCLFMRLPSIAKDNQSQFISIGQNLNLSKNKRYRFTVHVKWANPENSLKSAIISIWVKSTDGIYVGKDEWIYDGVDYKCLTFEFESTKNDRMFCYLSLLPHQEGYDNTDIYVDEFKIEEVGDALVEVDSRPENRNMLKNSGFDQGFENWLSTVNNPHGVSGLNCNLVNKNRNYNVCMELPASDVTGYLNNTWTGIYQELILYAGNEYQIEADIERIVPDSTQYESIMNIYVFKPGSPHNPPVWLGSVDHKFNKSGRHIYTQRIRPTQTDTCQIVLRLFGWGNKGNPVIINFDNIKVKRL